MEAIPLSQWLWLVSSWHKTVRHKLLLFLASQYPCIHLSLLAHVDHRSNVHTTLPASMCLPPQLEDLTKICVWEQWSTSPTKLSCWAWHVSSPPCFQFYLVILHPKCVKCMDLRGQGMQPGREPALSCPPFGGLQEEWHKCQCPGHSVHDWAFQYAFVVPIFFSSSDLSWAPYALWESYAFWNTEFHKREPSLLHSIHLCLACWG